MLLKTRNDGKGFIYIKPVISEFIKIIITIVILFAIAHKILPGTRCDYPSEPEVRRSAAR